MTCHVLLGVLPPDVFPKRKPVASAEILARPESAAIAGWEQLSIDLSSRSGGRHAMVVLDAAGRVVSASDWVYTRAESVVDGRRVVTFVHDNVGGRFEEGGTFRGTRWHSEIEEADEGHEIRNEMTPYQPTADEEAALRALVAEMLRRVAMD